MGKPKFQARSSRAADGSAFGFGGSFRSSFATATSPLSYLAEMPDISSISDPNTAVTFKNLLKKDGTTKTRALEDLQSLFTSKDNAASVDDAVLAVWVGVYPRTSIESDGRVRRLAHTVHGKICVAAGKRLAKHMPTLAGPWLLGSHDSDKLVASAAQSSLSLVFPSTEKISALRKAFQPQILELCSTIIGTESAQTLSDERVVSSDEASAKYYRVLAAAIGLVTSLICHLDPEFRSTSSAIYANLLANKKFWNSVSSEDANVRRATHDLLQECLSKHDILESLDLKLISASYVDKGLRSSQTNTAGQFVQALTVLSMSLPNVWTTEWAAKKPPLIRLSEFLRKGSQGASHNYWLLVSSLIKLIPRAACSKTREEVDQLLSSYYAGVTAKGEPKAYINSGSRGFLQLVSSSSQNVNEDDYTRIFSTHVLPMLEGFIFKVVDAKWDMSGRGATEIVKEALEIPNADAITAQEWAKFNSQLIENMKMSPPEQSKDHASSQNALGETGRRFAIVLSLLQETHADKDVLMSSTTVFVKEAVGICKTRQGKPFGVATVLEHLLQNCGNWIWASTELEPILREFLLQSVPTLIMSPSMKPLATIISTATSEELFEASWNASLEKVNAAINSNQLLAFKELLKAARSSPAHKTVMSNSSVHAKMSSLAKVALEQDGEWATITGILSAAQEEDLDVDILSSMTDSLSLTPHLTEHTLQGFEAIGKSHPQSLQTFLARSKGQELITSVLRLTEAPDDEIAQTASRVNDLIHIFEGRGTNGKSSSESGMVEVIRDGLGSASNASVSVHTLVLQAKALVSGKNVEFVKALLPNITAWKSEMQKFISVPPPVALGISSPLGSAVFCLNREPTDVTARPTVPRDFEGLPAILRMAMFVTELLSDQSVPLPDQKALSEILQCLILTTILANDNLGLVGANDVWYPHGQLIEKDMIEYVSRSQSLISKWVSASNTWWLTKDTPSDYSFVDSAINELFQSSAGKSSSAYYAARSYYYLVDELIQVHGLPHHRSAEIQPELMKLRKSKQFVQTVAYILCHSKALADVPIAGRWYNECIADLTRFNFGDDSSVSVERLGLLLAFLANSDTDFINIAAHQRLVFLVQGIVDGLKHVQDSPGIQTLMLSTLKKICPALLTVYGEHWEGLLDFVHTLWKQTGSLELDDRRNPTLNLIHESLKLVAVLKRMTSQGECNEDLTEAITATTADFHSGLLNLLSLDRAVPDEFHQPLRTVDELVCRGLESVPIDIIPAPEFLFHLLGGQSESIQLCAYTLLHKKIPMRQEEISMNLAIEQKLVRLPDELLSLILEAPNGKDVERLDLEQAVPLPLKGYLLCWILVFDHFKNGSHQLKNQYLDSLKEGGYLGPLLDFTFNFLGHSKGNVFNPSKLDITTFKPDRSSSPRQELRWLLCHIYFLSLEHASSLSKAWWMECKSRLIVQNVEDWTSNNISPYIISSALASVNSWAEEQQRNPIDDEGSALSIKTNRNTKEVLATFIMGHEDDERSVSICVRLPPSFPLRQATVVSVSNKTTFEDRRWRSWLMITQGVIAFSNNSIVDGLLAWRRNIMGALEGKSECTICYSLVSEDGKLPSKTCKTCKNSFHVLCLTKWFVSSGERKCPLCRTEFTGLGRGVRADRDDFQ